MPRPMIFQMKLAAAAGFTALMFALPVPATAAGLGEAGELEHARANARAGGPISARDAELLERWGCSSGTRNRFCHGLRVRSGKKVYYKKRYRKRYRRWN